ncbi:Uncharacterized [Moorella glycerini]|uniref:Uncharacterized protein n=2 Tax=Neomoorella TaxID=44260 RepID=A0A9X7J3N5_9FIRM|nr:MULTISPECIES: hypothetical protein [Moorella]KYH33772.1 hypothetical protein MOMUL_04820 [Moorella mulderi DSM 14980]PRR73108.1 hypothetical protein MOST_14730 [Moorella stamsii]CEP67746.1 Uncharacterized [Moorella glycerini]
MSALEVFKDEIKEYARLKIISEMVLIKEHIKLIEQKYGCNLKEMEQRIAAGKENFDLWDDYMEMKAYQRSLDELKNKIKELDHVKDIKIT